MWVTLRKIQSEWEINPFSLGHSNNRSSMKPWQFSINKSVWIKSNKTQTLLNGEDPKGWIYKCEQYNEFKEVEHQHQVQLAFFHLEGVALQWFQWMSNFKDPFSWAEFTKAVLHCFGCTYHENPYEALTCLNRCPRGSSLTYLPTKVAKIMYFFFLKSFWSIITYVGTL